MCVKRDFGEDSWAFATQDCGQDLLFESLGWGRLQPPTGQFDDECFASSIDRQNKTWTGTVSNNSNDLLAPWWI
jgi:hypothetical protein